MGGGRGCESPDGVLCARGSGDVMTLKGTKVCVGAGLCSHALVTARLPNGERACSRRTEPARVKALPSRGITAECRVGHPVRSIQQCAGCRGRAAQKLPK